MFEWLLAILAGAVLLSALARKLGAPYPSFLALGGAALAFVPGVPEIVLDPELALVVMVAPVLLDAAYDASVRDLRENWVPILGLALASVLVTAVAVAIVARALVPELPWAAAIALGAVVAPPDAAAAEAVLASVRLPKRIATILEGESLLNDATALLLYRAAVTAVSVPFLSWSGHIAPLALSLIGSLILGPLLALVWLRLIRNITDPPSSIILQFSGTFAVWILAESLGLSAILTIVSYAVTIARRAPSIMSASLRINAYAVWDTAVFLLNVLAFVLIGMQLRPIFDRLGDQRLGDSLVLAAAVVVTVILARLVWVMGYVGVLRAIGWRQKAPVGERTQGPTWSGAVVVSWAGMRGLVTLATALALPVHFPARDALVLSAFAVVLGTLVLQGLTLRWVIGRFDMSGPDPFEAEVRFARERCLRAAMQSLDGDQTPEALEIRREYRLRLDPDTPGAPGFSAPHDALRAKAVTAARREVERLRESEEIGDDAYHLIEEDLDHLEVARGPA